VTNPKGMPCWRLLRFECGDPRLNLAIDETILKVADAGRVPNTLRLWGNSRSVVLGISEEVENEVNLDACQRFGVQIVRRSSGGGTVYQDGGNLNWTVVVKREPSMFGEIRDVSEVFQTFAAPILMVLERLRLRGRFEPPASILVDGKKVSGMAASIKKGALLCHGSLLVDCDIQLMRIVLRNMKYPVANLSDLVRKEIPLLEMEEGIVRSFAETFDVEFVEGELLRDEHEIAQSLIEENQATISASP
jgi:lipoate-protein ligase A